MWAEARRTRGRLGRTLGPVNTAAVLADAMTDDVPEVGVDRAVTVSEQTGNSGSAAELNAFCRSVAHLDSASRPPERECTNRLRIARRVDWPRTRVAGMGQ